jgi:uncharacterized protein with PQ loop repeat
MASGEDKCGHLTPFQFGFGYALVFLVLFLAYLPQWIKIIKSRSHAGLSLENFCCAAFSTILALLSIVSDTWGDVKSCCRTGSAHTCMSTAQPLIQQGVTAICAHLVVLFYFLNFSLAWCEKQGRDPAKEYKFTKLMCSILIGAGLLWSVICLGLFLTPNQHGLKMFARVAATVNALLVSCHWGFQIRETHHAKCAGSLSLFSLFVCSVGSFLVRVLPLSLWPEPSF